MGLINVAVLGASGRGGFAWIAQSLLCELEDHPFFRITACVADLPSQEGKLYGESFGDWYEERPLTQQLRSLPVLPANGNVLREQCGIRLVLSSLPPDRSRRLDLQLAATGIPVVSESPGLRGDDDIPLITPEINSDHLNIIPAQRRNRGWSSGFVVANPGCTYTILALALKPILDKFGIDKALIATMQAISGAGPSAIPGLNIINNVIPYIPMEEAKLYTEVPKILGSLDRGEIIPANFRISATCSRVPVRDGHTAIVFLECQQEVDPESAIEAWQAFYGPPQELELPSAPMKPIDVAEEIDRPQPRLDLTKDHGRRVTIGRIRTGDTLTNELAFVITGHNRKRGTYGNTLLNAEMIARLGWLEKKLAKERARKR